MTTIQLYRDVAKQLQEYRKHWFPRGTVVEVDCAQYKGCGICTINSDCRPDQLSVRLENGNTWWYPLECCEPFSGDTDDLPMWIQRELKIPGGVYYTPVPNLPPEAQHP